MKQRFILTSLVVLCATICNVGYAFRIDARGAWHGLDSEAWHAYDPLLSEGVAKFFKKEGAHSIVDMGCGMGDYVNHLSKSGFDCYGIDANPDTPELTKGLAEVGDLTESFDLGKRFDWVLCLEVGEHIPKKYQDVLIDNLVKHAEKGIVLSWAVAGQTGPGHVNTMDNEDVIKIFASLDAPFVFDPEATKTLRKSLSVHWFTNTVMVFRRASDLNQGEE